MYSDRRANLCAVGYARSHSFDRTSCSRAARRNRPPARSAPGPLGTVATAWCSIQFWTRQLRAQIAPLDIVLTRAKPWPAVRVVGAPCYAAQQHVDSRFRYLPGGGGGRPRPPKRFALAFLAPAAGSTGCRMRGGRTDLPWFGRTPDPCVAPPGGPCAAVVEARPPTVFRGGRLTPSFRQTSFLGSFGRPGWARGRRRARECGPQAVASRHETVPLVLADRSFVRARALHRSRHERCRTKHRVQSMRTMRPVPRGLLGLGQFRSAAQLPSRARRGARCRASASLPQTVFSLAHR